MKVGRKISVLVSIFVFALILSPFVHAEDKAAPADEQAAADEEDGSQSADEPKKSLFATEEAELPKITKPLNKRIEIVYKCGDETKQIISKKKRKKHKKCKRKVIKGKLIGVYMEMVPSYTTDKVKWLPMRTLTIVTGIDEIEVPWRDVKKIYFNEKFEEERMQNDNNRLNLVTCTSDLEISPNWLECTFAQQYNVKVKGKKPGYVAQKRKLLFLVKTKKGLERIPVYLGLIRINNSKDESYNEKDLAKILFQEYVKNPVKIIIK